MEIMMWLKPSIDNAVVAAAGACEEKNAERINEMDVIIKRLREVLPANKLSDIDRIENLVLECIYHSADVAYRIGFSEALKIASL